MLTCVAAGEENHKINFNSCQLGLSEAYHKKSQKKVVCQQMFCQSLPESAWGAVSSVHVGKARADHRMTGHLTSLAAQSLQGRVVTVGELKKEKKVFRAVLLVLLKLDLDICCNQVKPNKQSQIIYFCLFFVSTNIKSLSNALQVKETICGWISLPFLPEIVSCAL